MTQGKTPKILEWRCSEIGKTSQRRRDLESRQIRVLVLGYIGILLGKWLPLPESSH